MSAVTAKQLQAILEKKRRKKSPLPLQLPLPVPPSPSPVAPTPENLIGQKIYLYEDGPAGIPDTIPVEVISVEKKRFPGIRRRHRVKYIDKLKTEWVTLSRPGDRTQNYTLMEVEGFGIRRRGQANGKTNKMKKIKKRSTKLSTKRKTKRSTKRKTKRQ